MSQRVICALFGVRFIKSCTTQALSTKLVQSLVTSHLDYCSVVYQDASLGLKARLQQLSNAAIRYIFGIRRMIRISPFRGKLGWLRIDSRMHYFSLLTMHKVVRIKEPPLLAKLFKNYVPERLTRGVCTDREIPKGKKGVFLPSLWGYTIVELTFPRNS